MAGRAAVINSFVSSEKMLFERWVKFLLEAEGSTVVQEPNGKWSKYGLTHESRAVASAFTLRDHRAAATKYWMRVSSYAAGRYPVTSIEFWQLVDFDWNAGVANARTAFNSGRVTSFISNHYADLGATPMYKKYAKGWHNRRLKLIRSYYRVAL